MREIQLYLLILLMISLSLLILKIPSFIIGDEKVSEN